MIALLALSALLQQQPDTAKRTASQRRADSISKVVQKRIAEHQAAARDSRIREQQHQRDAMAKLTPEMLASAYKDAGARDLLLRARAARRTQDSALVSYDANVYQRVSAWLGFGRMSRDRLIFRMEQAGRVQWQRDVGVWMTVLGARSALPGIPDEGQKESRKDLSSESGDIAPVPYYPGAEQLWAGQELTHDTIQTDEIIHPLAVGSEVYYTYASGDSITFRLADGTVIHIRSLEVRPRTPEWNLVVGSLWFDTRTAQLVRAAYRFAAPMHIDKVVTDDDPHAFDDVPVWVKPMIFPMHAELAAVTLEYSLHDSRFWLPKERIANGSATASFVRVPFELKQSFNYNSVNGADTLPKIPMPVRAMPPAGLDSSGIARWRDSVNTAGRAARRAHRDSIRFKLIPPDLSVCDTSEVRTSTAHVGESRIPMAVRTPCNIDSLEHSKYLPPSIFDPGDELFDEKSRQELMNQALSMSAQAPFLAKMQLRLLPPPRLDYGLYMTRYNRVEGVSVGAGVEQDLGGGYLANLTGRLSTARWSPDLEGSLTRSNLTSAVSATAYHRLESASDWGNPLSFGSSLSGVLFGRDEGFYYRTTGVSLAAKSEIGAKEEVRLFVQKEGTADVSTTFGLMSQNSLPNIQATNRTYAGGLVSIRASHGEDPNGFRVFSDLRFEAAKSDSLYGRAALDLTFTQGLTHDVVGALTLAAGSSVGYVPPQRLWYLGGTPTIRGEKPDTAQSGNAFKMVRLEFGKTVQGVRVVLFNDVGWVGDRNRFHITEWPPLAGAGVGTSFLDGLIRFDLARGIYPLKQFRFSAYLDGVF
jgi:hypothetical protein